MVSLFGDFIYYYIHSYMLLQTRKSYMFPSDKENYLNNSIQTYVYFFSNFPKYLRKWGAKV